MAASTLSIVLPEPFKTYVEAQVEDGLYPSATVLIRSLLEEQQQREAKALQQAARQVLARQGALDLSRRACVA